jgi:hypothetical protein
LFVPAIAMNFKRKRPWRFRHSTPDQSGYSPPP